MTDQPRTPAGSPIGGQFAATARPETGLELDAPAPHADLTVTGLDTLEDPQLRAAADRVADTLRDAGEGGTLAPAREQRTDSAELTFTDAAGDRFDIGLAEDYCRVVSTDRPDIGTGDVDWPGPRDPFSTTRLPRHLAHVRRGIAATRTFDAITSQRTGDVTFTGPQAWPDRGCARVAVTAVIDGEEYTLETAGYEPVDVDSVDVLHGGHRLPKLLRHAVLHRTGEALAAPRGDGLIRAASTLAAWSRAVTHDPAWRP